MLFSNPKPFSGFEDIIAKIEDKPMTPEEIREQRISFAYGNALIENPKITRETIEEAHRKIYGY